MRLAPPNVGHPGRNQRQKLNIGIQGKASHINNSAGNVACIDDRFFPERPVRLPDASVHCRGEFCPNVANVDLATRNVKCPTI